MIRSVPTHTITLGSDTYLIARTERARSWKKSFRNEPPWVEADDGMLSVRIETWHLGGFKTKPGIDGTSEQGSDTDGRFPFRLRPSPKINSVTLTGSAADPTSIFKAKGYIFAVCGRYVFKIDPATDTVTSSKDLGAGVTGIMGLEDEAGNVLVTLDATTTSLWRCTAIGSPDTWAQTADAACNPYRLARGINRLFRISKAGVMRNLSTGLSPLTEANWADTVQCGGTDTTKPPTGLIAFDRTVLAARQEAVYGVDGESGYGIPVIKRVVPSAYTGAGMAVVEPYVLVPHSRGLGRYTPGMFESIGLEREILNESSIKGGVFRAFAVDGQWIFAAYQVGSSSNILVARDRRSGEPSLAPMIWDTFVNNGANTCGAMYLDTDTDPPRLWFGRGNNIAYIKLADPLAEFAVSGTRTSHKYDFGDWGSKDFPKVDVVVSGADLSANIYWDLYYSVDGAAFSMVDRNSANMRSTAAGRSTFYLPNAAVGREIQYRLNYTSNDATKKGEVLFVEGFAIPQARKFPILELQLKLAHNQQKDLERETRDVAEQRSDLEALIEAATTITAIGPWGTYQVQPKKIEEIEMIQNDDGEEEVLVSLTCLVRETS